MDPLDALDKEVKQAPPEKDASKEEIIPPTEGAWRSKLLDSELKSSSELKTFKTVEALAKAYVNSSKLLSERHAGVGKDDSFESFIMKQDKFLRSPEKSEYKNKSEVLNDLGFKYKLHPNNQFNEFIKEVDTYNQGEISKNTDAMLKEWDIKNTEQFKTVEGKDEVLGKAFKKLDMTREGFEKDLKSVSKHPVVVKMLLKLGQEATTTKEPMLTGGNPSGHSGSMADKKAYVLSQTTNGESAYYKKNSPSHVETQMKVDRYIKEIADNESKTGEKSYPQFSSSKGL